MKLIASIFAILAIPSFAQGEGPKPVSAAIAKPIRAVLEKDNTNTNVSDQVPYRVTFTIVRVVYGQSHPTKVTALVFSHQKAAIFSPPAYLLVGSRAHGSLHFDAYAMKLVACPNDVTIPDLQLYSINVSTQRRSNGDATPSCVIL